MANGGGQVANKWGVCHLFFFLVGLLVACGPSTITPTPVATSSPRPTLITTAPSPSATSGEMTPTPRPTFTATATFGAYPPATVSPSPMAYPVLSPTVETPTFVPAGATPIAQLFLPIISQPPPSPTPIPPPASPTPIPTVDFAAVRIELLATGQELGFAKIGFHVGPGGNMNGLGDWMKRLDEAGVPFFLKSVDNAGPLLEAQQLIQASGVAHTLVFRLSGPQFDTPDYTRPADEAARTHWALHKANFPPELDPNLVWFETLNEVDDTRAEWFGQFALTTAQLALSEGYRWAAFGWASGEPDLALWESPTMLEFLRLVAANPGRLAIAVHEYSYLASDIGHEYPFKLGRFLQLFQICDRYGIARPDILITEWGWEYETVPPVESALGDVAWASALYAPFPEVKGAALWYLGPGFNEIADQAQQLIQPMMIYSLSHYFAIPLSPAQASPDPNLYWP